MGTASKFTMSEYHDAPNETRMKSLIKGLEAQPLPGGRYLIKQLRLELFDESGKPQAIVEAPECVYDAVKRTADSGGELRVDSGDGALSIQGTGFLWRQDESTLTISNKVHTTIRDMKRPSDKP